MYLCPGNGSYLESSLPLCQYAGSASGPYQSKTAATSGCALHITIIMYIHISQTHTRTHRDRDVCLDGCTHNVN